ncbi:MAG: hypothetical protein Q7R67_00250 [bacterium]|nr:hypothetical protein [bacterium]
MDPEEKSPLKQIRTFQGDVADALHRQNESLVSIQQTEASRRRASPDEVVDSEISERRKKTFFLLIGSLFFIILGIAGAWYGYREYLRKTAPPTPVTPSSRLISPESAVTLDLSTASREIFLSRFAEAIIDVPAGALRHVILRNGPTVNSPLLETAGFFKILESQAPASLVRSFEPIFMVGALGESPFLIIKLSSFESAFAGMLAWEPNMAPDVAPLLGTEELLKVIPSTSVFKDVIVRNKDVRMLESSSVSTTSTSSGQASSPQATPIILYSFFDNRILIITENSETLQILMDRLTREKLSR